MKLSERGLRPEEHHGMPRLVDYNVFDDVLTKVLFVLSVDKECLLVCREVAPQILSPNIGGAGKFEVFLIICVHPKIDLVGIQILIDVKKKVSSIVLTQQTPLGRCRSNRIDLRVWVKQIVAHAFSNVKVSDFQE